MWLVATAYSWVFLPMGGFFIQPIPNIPYVSDYYNLCITEYFYPWELIQTITNMLKIRYVAGCYNLYYSWVFLPMRG